MSIYNFVWQGKNSADYKLAFTGIPSISYPPKRCSETLIDGRNSAIIRESGYQPYNIELELVYIGDDDYFSNGFRTGMETFFFKKPSDKHLENKLVLPTETNWIYTAYLLEQIDFEELNKYKHTSVKFHCQPLKENAQVMYNKRTTNTSTSSILFRAGTGAGYAVPRQPKLLVHISDYSSVTSGTLFIEIKNGETNGDAFVGRRFAIAHSVIRAFCDNPVYVLDFENDEFYVCYYVEDYPLEEYSDVDMYTKEHSVLDLTRYVFGGSSADIKASGFEQPISTWHDIEFTDMKDYIKVYFGDGESKPCEILEYMSAKSL